MSPVQLRNFISVLLPAICTNSKIHWSTEDPDEREERTQEAVAQGFAIYDSACRRGVDDKAYAGSLTRFAAGAVDDGRSLAGHSSTDVLARQRCTVESLDREITVTGDDGTPESMPIADALIDRRTWQRPLDAVRVKLDYTAFESSGLASKRAIEAFRLLAQGYTNGEIAKHMAVSPPRVSQLFDELRESLSLFFDWPVPA